jgi:serine/threonine protein phosphatase PrpC
MCHVANLGDTRAVLSLNDGVAKRLTIDHKVSNISEQERIKFDYY